jgi:hypothetical protein
MFGDTVKHSLESLFMYNLMFDLYKDRFGMKSDFENLGVDQLHPREVNQVIDYYTCTNISSGKFHNMVMV